MFELGSRVGPYEILHVIGMGGMGTVCLARDTRLGREVALKFLNSDLTSLDPDGGRGRLLREARAASALNHPGICQIYDVGGEHADAWIAMEYVDGTPLDTLVAHRPLSPDKAARIGRQLADALAHAHRRGIIHRDLKTANIVCDKDERPKMLDFGIAARLPDSVAQEATRTGTASPSPSVAGSLPYMAPELLMGLPPDERTDLWSLGVVMYEMLAGTRPFGGRTGFETAKAILEGTPRPLPAGVPAPLARIVMRLISRDPAERYANASEVAAALDPQTAASVHPPSTRADRRVLLLAAAVVAGLGAAGFVWQFLSDRSSDYTPVGIQRMTRMLTFKASSGPPSYSPDGATLATVEPDTRGIQQIWIRSPALANGLQLTSGDVHANRPRWSPKNDQIIYGVAGQGIWSISPLGGAARRLLERGVNPNFSRDGNRLVFESERAIWTAAADGSDVRRVEGTPPLYYGLPMGPAISPDGSTIAFFHAEAGPNGDLWTIPIGGGTARRLTFDLREGGWPVWSPDGKAIIFSSARAGSRNLWQIPAKGGEPLPVTTGAGEDDQPDLSPDGRHLAFTTVRNRWDLRVKALGTQTDRTLLQRSVEILMPMFSPDGRRIVFFGRADYAVAVFTIAADGSDMRQLTAAQELNHHPQWSHDGQSIYFFQLKPTVTLRRISDLGGPSVEFRKWAWQTAHAPHFSPDGRFIAYTRQRPLGAPRTVPEHTIVHEVASGQETAWPEPHVHVGGWSSDGRDIVGWRHPNEIVTCRVEAWNCSVLTQGGMPNWPADSDRIYFTRPADQTAPQQLWSIGTDGSGERHEMELGTFRSIDVSVNVSRNRDVVWAPFQAGQHELWTATLK